MHLINFEATKKPVDPGKLRVRGGRDIKYNGEQYKIKSIDTSSRKDKKYVATVENKTTGKVHNVHWGHTGYDDYYVHRDKKRRENFQKRHGGIKLKDGTIAADDPKQPAYYATKANWSYMSNIANFGDDSDEDMYNETSNDAPIVKRLGRFRDLQMPKDKEFKGKKKLSLADELDMRAML